MSTTYPQPYPVVRAVLFVLCGYMPIYENRTKEELTKIVISLKERLDRHIALNEEYIEKLVKNQEKYRELVTETEERRIRMLKQIRFQLLENKQLKEELDQVRNYNDHLAAQILRPKFQIENETN